MNSRLQSQEEQITEYNDKIAAVEEELKRVSVNKVSKKPTMIIEQSE